VFGNIVDEKRSDGASVVRGGDGPVSFLAGSIPNLRFDCFAFDLSAERERKRRAKLTHFYTPRCKLDTDSWLGLEVELVSCESTEKVGFSDTWISDQDDLEEIVVFVVASHRYFSSSKTILKKTTDRIFVLFEGLAEYFILNLTQEE
jgi:hypothetical protein